MTSASSAANSALMTRPWAAFALCAAIEALDLLPCLNCAAAILARPSAVLGPGTTVQMAATILGITSALALTTRAGFSKACVH